MMCVDSWSPQETVASFGPRAGHSVVVSGQTVLLMGGVNKGNVYNGHHISPRHTHAATDATMPTYCPLCLTSPSARVRDMYMQMCIALIFPRATIRQVVQ